ncbi:MAG: hypothetical protein QXU64_02025 [Thermofilaceae archaeon]
MAEEARRIRIELERLIKAPFTTEHETVLEAVLADLADALPLVGEIAGIVRMIEALEKGDDTRALMELGDLIAGAPPSIGDVLDILTPTNTMAYLLRKRGLKA